jgi:hypothetical protein
VCEDCRWNKFSRGYQTTDDAVLHTNLQESYRRKADAWKVASERQLSLHLRATVVRWSLHCYSPSLLLTCHIAAPYSTIVALKGAHALAIFRPPEAGLIILCVQNQKECVLTAGGARANPYSHKNDKDGTHLGARDEEVSFPIKSA